MTQPIVHSKLALLLAAGITMTGAQASFAASAVTATPGAAQPTAETSAPAAREAGDTTAQTRNATRSRLRECGHQWSAMKKNGTAAGMTWKDYSQGCLTKP